MIDSSAMKTVVDRRRKQLGITQRELAESMGMSRQLMLGRINTIASKGSLSFTFTLAESLGVSVNTLLREMENVKL